MKKLFRLFAVGSLAFATQTATFAETSAPPAAPADHPCKAVEAVCEAAGFLPRQHKQAGKGLWMDCMRPLMGGQSVAGVKPSAADLAACKAHRAKRRQNDQQQ